MRFKVNGAHKCPYDVLLLDRRQREIPSFFFYLFFVKKKKRKTILLFKYTNKKRVRTNVVPKYYRNIALAVAFLATKTLITPLMRYG